VFRLAKFNHPPRDGVMWWSTVFRDINQLLIDFGGIQPFSGKRLCDCSKLDIRYFKKKGPTWL
jgi:hypothetical protein